MTIATDQERHAAVTYLHGAGAHFVLCAGKRPLWRRWQKRRPPLDICLTHPEIGLVPFSVGTSALDVDVGEIGELIEAAPPLVTVPIGSPEMVVIGQPLRASARPWSCR